MRFCDGFDSLIYSGKPDEGTGSSFCPGCAAAGGSDASIDFIAADVDLGILVVRVALELPFELTLGGARDHGAAAAACLSLPSFTAASPSPTIATV